MPLHMKGKSTETEIMRKMQYEIWNRNNKAFGFEFFDSKFGGFQHFSGKQTFLVIITAAAMLAIIIYIAVKRPKNPLIMTSLTMILAGGTGNLYDRIVLNGVRDFFDFRIINFAV